MTDTIFDIGHRRPQAKTSSLSTIHSSYNLALQTYLAQSYSISTEAFIKKIALKVQSQHSKLLKVQSQHSKLLRFDFRRQMRQLCKRFMLTDLELVFFIYFSNSNKWNFSHEVIVQNKGHMKMLAQNQPVQAQFKFYLYLMAFFVKKYVGDKDELKILQEFYQNQIPYFNQIHQQWVQKNQQSEFTISPRQLNAIYSQFSKNTNPKSCKKDYNSMVDQILQLSTTYSIMPNREQKKTKQKKQTSNSFKEESSPQKKHKRSFQSGIFQFSPKYDMSDIKMKKKKQSIIISGISQYQQIGKHPNFFNQSIAPKGSKRLVSLKKKKHQDKQGQINNVVKNYFQNKEPSQIMEEQKKNQSNIPVSFFDLNVRSSGIQSLPFQLRSNSNIFGPSRLF